MRRQLINIGTYGAVLVALVDQISKWWIIHYVMNPPGRVEVFSNLNFVLSWNKGVTFGLLNGFHEWQPYILAGLAALICLLLLRWLWEASTIKAALGLGLIIGGAMGNVVDRLRYGAVVDFLDVHAFGYHWYTFNMADSAIVVGVGFLLLENLALTWKRR